MLDFPDNPAVDEVFRNWRWDGVKWVAGGGPVGDFVERAGDTMTGNLRIRPPSSATLFLDKDQSGNVSMISGELAGVPRWRVHVADPTPEVGGNSGSNFVFRRFSDAGAMLGDALTINRANGVITTEGGLAVGGNLAVVGNLTTNGDITTRHLRTDGEITVGGRVIRLDPNDSTKFIWWDGASFHIGGGNLYLNGEAILPPASPAQLAAHTPLRTITTDALKGALAPAHVNVGVTSGYENFAPNYNNHVNYVLYAYENWVWHFPQPWWGSGEYEMSNIIGRSGWVLVVNSAAAFVGWDPGYTFDKMELPDYATGAGVWNLFAYTIYTAGRIHINLLGSGLS